MWLLLLLFRLQPRSGEMLVLPWTTTMHQIAFRSLHRNDSWRMQVEITTLFNCTFDFAVVLLLCSLPHFHFLNWPDEPESKKLAAQSDLDSATALCEFHPIMLSSVYFLLRDVYNPQSTVSVVCIFTIACPLFLCSICVTLSSHSPAVIQILSLSFCCCSISAIGAQLAALAQQRWEFSVDFVLCRSIDYFVSWQWRETRL